MNGLVILGFIGQAAFFMRFLVQWVASEKRGEGPDRYPQGQACRFHATHPEQNPEGPHPVH